MKSENESYRNSNPFVLVNVGSIGTNCGRAASIEEAKQLISDRGGEFIEVRGNQVFFRAPIYL